MRAPSMVSRRHIPAVGGERWGRGLAWCDEWDGCVRVCEGRWGLEVEG